MDEPIGHEGRRARQRRQLLADIETEARRLLDEGGAGNVSIRAIARAVGLGPASLYTYVDSLDGIFTMLLLSSYRGLAGATAAAVDRFRRSPPVDRAFAGILAHRHWALHHRNEFNLLFTDQLPGYAAPPGGPTVDAQFDVFSPIIEALADALPTDSGLGPDEFTVVIWSAFHGAVTLEVNHHLDWLGDTAALHETAVRRSFASVGLADPSRSLRPRFERWVAAG